MRPVKISAGPTLCLEYVLISAKFRGSCCNFYLLGKKREEMATQRARCWIRVRQSERLCKMINNDKYMKHVKKNKKKTHLFPRGKFEQLQYLHISGQR